MEENKDIGYFEKMIAGAERLIKSWKLALILTNAFWAAVVIALLVFAYLVPHELEQKQDFPNQTQEQSYSGG